MGTSVYLKNGVYQIGIRWKGRKLPSVSSGTHDRFKAQRQAAAIWHDLERGTYEERARRLSFTDFLVEYEKAYLSAGGAELQASRKKSWMSSAKRGLDPFVRYAEENGVRSVDRVTDELAEGFLDWRLQPHPARGEWKALREVRTASANHDLRACKAAFSWLSRKAPKEFRLRLNPFRNARQKPIPNHVIYWLRQADAERFVAAVRGTPLEQPVALMLYAGLRLEEALNIRWFAIDFDANVVRVLNMPEHGFVTKSRQLRAVPMAPEMRTMLLGWRGDPAKLDPSKLVVPCATGGKFDDKNMSKRIRLAGREMTPPLKVSPQVLRRTFGSLLREARVPLDRISLYLGHSRIEVTERWYAGLDIDGDVTDVAKLSFTRPAPFGVVEGGAAPPAAGKKKRKRRGA